jgi:hypothetical protein
MILLFGVERKNVFHKLWYASTQGNRPGDKKGGTRRGRTPPFQTRFGLFQQPHWLF